MSELELQEEEREALLSIYDGDELFKQIDNCSYQYKVGVLHLKVFCSSMLFFSMEKTTQISPSY